MSKIETSGIVAAALQLSVLLGPAASRASTPPGAFESPEKGSGPRGSSGDPARAAAATIRALVDQAFAVLRDEALKKDPARRFEQLRAVADRHVDWMAMARGCLGPTWRKLSEAQRKEFSAVFSEHLARRYQESLNRFRGTEKVAIVSVEARGELQLVSTSLVTASGDAIPIVYTLYAERGSWKIEDIRVEGASFVKHYRETFARFLVNADFAALLARLRRRLGDAAAPSP